MTPELKQRIDKEAKDYCDLQIGDRAKFHYKDPIHVLWLNEFAEYIAIATPWAEQLEALERWKAEASTLLDPLIEYGQAHPDIKLGTSITEFILNRARAYDSLLERAEKLREALEKVLLLIQPYTPQQIREIKKGINEALEQYKKETA